VPQSGQRVVMPRRCLRLSVSHPASVDLVAERIRALGAPAPASYHEFAALTAIPEDDDRPDATEMIRRLISGQETVVRTARSVFPVVERANDEPHCGPPHPTDAGPREDRLDAAEPPRLNRASAGLGLWSNPVRLYLDADGRRVVDAGDGEADEHESQRE
jgi:hypothetical protein